MKNWKWSDGQAFSGAAWGAAAGAAAPDLKRLSSVASTSVCYGDHVGPFVE